MQPLDRALLEMHEQLWDDDAGMVRLYGLHLVRETALGAFLDLEHGRVDRARRALHNVLGFQYLADNDPRWAGTFKTHAGQPDAGTQNPEGRTCDQQWRDYDPNWRQFLGLILTITDRLYGHVLTAELRQSIQRAASLAARSEPPHRINASYSNIALLQMWLADATRTNDGRTLATDFITLFNDQGDLAEYNSPTYDAISLLAACLLADSGSTTVLRDLGNDVIRKVCDRLNAVWHPTLGLQAGPYSRSYGLDPRLYVSLVSVLMTSLDIPAGGPTHLNESTTHVHDLYFLPLFRRVCGSLRRHLSPTTPTRPRRHEHRRGSIFATSIVEQSLVVGWEHGRRDRFAFDQYAPFAMFDANGFIGVRTRADTDWVDVIELAPHIYELRCARRTLGTTTPDLASLTVVASRAPVTHENEMLFGPITLQFPGIAVEVRLAT